MEESYASFLFTGCTLDHVRLSVIWSAFRLGLGRLPIVFSHSYFVVVLALAFASYQWVGVTLCEFAPAFGAL